MFPVIPLFFPFSFERDRHNAVTLFQDLEDSLFFSSSVCNARFLSQLLWILILLIRRTCACICVWVCTNADLNLLLHTPSPLPFVPPFSRLHCFSRIGASTLGFRLHVPLCVALWIFRGFIEERLRVTSAGK